MKGLLLNVILACGALLAVILVWVLLVAPAGQRLEEAQVQGELKARSAESRLPEIASEPYLAGLRQVKGRATAGLQRLRKDLAGQEARLEAWFPRLEERSNGLPPVDSFQSAYEFAQDRLREYVRDEVQRTTRIKPEEVPLVKPLFQLKDRLPEAEELQAAQREFNVQNVVLQAAARGGAWPVAPLRIKPEWSESDPDKKFRATRVTGEFRAAASMLPALLRSLLELDGDGPFVRLSGLRTQPLPAPTDLGADEPLLLNVEVDLELVALVTRS